MSDYMERNSSMRRGARWGSRRLLLWLGCLLTVLLLAGAVGCGGEDTPAPFTVLCYETDGAEPIVLTVTEDGRIQAPALSRYGYRYLGLYDGQGICAVEADGTSELIVRSDLVLYARWEPERFELLLQADGGSCDLTELPGVAYDGAVPTLPTVTAPLGYRFLGWENTDGVQVTDGQGAPLPAFSTLTRAGYPASGSQVTLRARYAPMTYTLTFRYGEGIDDAVRVLSYGDRASDILYPSAPPEDGVREFIGWSLLPDEDIALTDEPERYRIDSDLVFYARYRTYRTLTLWLQPTDPAPITVRVYPGVTFVPPERDGYTLSGWYSDADRVTAPLSGLDHEVPGDTYYAAWTPTVYTLRFSVWEGVAPAPLSFTVESAALTLPLSAGVARPISRTPRSPSCRAAAGGIPPFIPAIRGMRSPSRCRRRGGSLPQQTVSAEYAAFTALPVPVHTGYAFTGWYDGERQLTDGAGHMLAPLDTLLPLTLTAHYERLYALTVEVLPAGAATVSGAGHFTVGATVSLQVTAHEGYRLVGISGYRQTVADTLQFSMPPCDVTLTVTLTPLNYLLRLDAAGGGLSSAAVQVTYTTGQAAALPVPSRSGYRFLGWYDGSLRVTGEDGVLPSDSTWVPLQEDSLLRAVWGETAGQTAEVELLTTPEQLLAALQRGSGHYRLGADILLADDQGRLPRDFTGSLDGCGYTVYGLRQPLFQTLTGSVRDLSLQVTIDGSAGDGTLVPSVLSFGALCCTLRDGALIGVRATGSLTVRQWRGTAGGGVYAIGGLVGHVDTGASVSYCEVDMTVQDLSADRTMVGGLIGYMTSGTELYRCQCAGSVTGYRAAGILGVVAQLTTLSLRDCTVTAAVVAGYRGGGLVAYAPQVSLTFSRCVSGGSVLCEGTPGLPYRYCGVARAVTYQQLPVQVVATADDLRQALLYALPGECIRMSCDIDLGGIAFTVPTFSGTLDGDGHALRGLSAPLFECLSGAAVRDLALAVSWQDTLNAGTLRGALVNSMSDSLLERVSVTGQIVSAVSSADGGAVSAVSGLVGSVSGRCVLSGCTASLDIQAPDESGRRRGTSGVCGLVATVARGAECLLLGCEVGGRLSSSDVAAVLVNDGELTCHATTLTAVLTAGERAAGVALLNRGTLLVSRTRRPTQMTGRQVSFYTTDGTEGSLTVQQAVALSVATEAELAALREAPRCDSYYLTGHIVLTDWQPFCLRASLDGRGYAITGYRATSRNGGIGIFSSVEGEISHLTVSDFHLAAAQSGSEAVYFGVLTDLVQGGRLTDVTVADGTLQLSGGTAGALVGQMQGGTVSDCHSSLALSGAGCAGGLIGYVAYGTVENCSHTAAVSANTAGGLIGEVYKSGDLRLHSLLNTGAVTGRYLAGGIVGRITEVAGSTQLRSLRNEGSVTVTERQTPLSTAVYVGGIAGCYTVLGRASGRLLTAADLTNAGDVSGDTYVGGIIGCLSQNGGAVSGDAAMTVVLTRLENTGSIRGSSHLGGIGGALYGTSVAPLQITEAYNEGSVQGTGSYIGGLVGSLGQASLSSAGNHGSFANVLVGAAGENQTSEGIGGLVGYATSLTLGQVHTTVAVSVTGRTGRAVGGYIGYLSGGSLSSGLISATVYASGMDEVGGLVGRADSLSGPVSAMRGETGVQGRQHVGGLFGLMSMAPVMQACSFSGSVAASGSYAGGLCGQYIPRQAVTLSGLCTAGSVSGDAYVGGAFGMLGGGVETVLLGATSTTRVTANSAYAGTLVGDASVTLRQCSNASATLTVTGSAPHDIGGLVGRATVLDGCTNAAAVSVTGGERIGGVAGLVTVSAADCRNTAAVTATAGQTVGGVIGHYQPDTAVTPSLQALTNQGNVTARQTVGGVVGQITVGRSTAIPMADLSFLSNEGTVTAEQYAGGIAGQVTFGYLGAQMSLLGSYGSVVATQRYAGGLFGGVSRVENGSQVLTVRDDVRGKIQAGDQQLTGRSAIVGTVGSYVAVADDATYAGAPVGGASSAGDGAGQDPFAEAAKAPDL